MALDKEDAKLIAAEIAKLTKGATPSASASALPTAATSMFKDKLEETAKSINPFTKGIDLLKTGADAAKTAFEQIHAVIQPNLDTFRDLSKSGASFSNDLAGMVVAQKGMQLSTEEFTEIMKTNAGNFTGLGGSVTRGAEAFARLSKEFLESEFTDGLKQAGYSTKELNDVLALQATMQRYTFREDEASRKASIESAAKLATEMDLQAKLTGKSREEQMAVMRQVKEDAAIEAKFRMIGLEKGQDAEKAARDQYAKEFKDAQLAGVEKVFRESALYGTTVSKEAAMQGMAAGSTANKAIIDAGRAFKDGEFKRSEILIEKAQAEIITHQRSAAFLQTAMIPAQNALVESQQRGIKTNQGVYDALQKVGQMEEHKFKSDTEKLQIAKELAAKAAAGQNEQGQQVDGATRAIINFGSRIGETEAALYKGIVEPINKMVSPALGQLADKTLGRDTVRKDGTSSTYAQDVAAVIAQGQAPKPTPEPGSKLGFTPKRGSDADQTNIPGAGIISNAAGIMFNGANLFTQAIERFNASQAEPKKRQTGTIGMTGNLFEDFGAGTMVQLHGKETVLTEKQLLDMAKGIETSSMNQPFDLLKNATVSSTTKPASSNVTAPNQTNVKQHEEIIKSVMPSITNNMQAMAKQNEGMFQSMMPSIANNMQAMAKQNEGMFQSMMPNIANNMPADIQSIMQPGTDNIQSSIPKNMMSSLQNIDLDNQFRTMSEKLSSDANKRIPKSTVSVAQDEDKTVKMPDSARQKETKSTLDDVVGSLNQLNTKIERLLDAQLDIGNKQIRATKSNNNNIFARS